MANMKYCRPSDIITSQAVFSAVTGTVSTDADYGIPSLYDGNPAKPLKFTDSPVVAIRLVADLGTATRVDGLALPNSNIDAGLVMRAEQNATDVWTSPSVSVNMTMGTRHLDGHRASPWADFTTASGYSTGGYRYVSLYVPVNSAAPKLGELLIMARLREFSRYATFGGNKVALRRYVESLETEYGAVRILSRRIKQRCFTVTVRGSDTDYDDLQALGDDCDGRAHAFFIAADGSVKTDGGLYVRFTSQAAAKLAATEEWFDVNPFSVDIEEVSRSLPL